MNLSTIFNFAFICVPKTGSTSISEAIRPYCTINYELRPSLKHLTCENLNKHILPFHQKLFPNTEIEIFCVMREPLDWIHSWYRFRSRPDLKNPDHIMAKNYCGDISFNNYVEALLSDQQPDFANIGSQSRYICLNNGSIGVDKIFIWEKGLSDVFEYVCEKIGSTIKIPEKNISPRKKMDISNNLIQELKIQYKTDFDLYESLKNS